MSERYTRVVRISSPLLRAWLAFGRPHAEIERYVGLSPGTVFAHVVSDARGPGRERWRIVVARTGAPGERLVRIPGIVPGARPYLHLSGKGRTRRVLRELEEIRRQKIDLADVSPAWFRSLAIRVGEGFPPSRYTLEQHKAHLAFLGVGA